MSAITPTHQAALKDALNTALGQYRLQHPRSEEQHHEARKVMPGGSTRGSIWFAPFPVVIEDGWDARLRSVDGHEYIDFLGEYTVAIAGHNPGPVREAIARQLNHGWSYGAHSLQEQRAAAAVCGRFPAIERVRFTNSGTEANLLAISLARAVTGRDKVVVFRGGYHGAVFGFGATISPLNAPFPFIIAPYNDLAGTLQAIGDHASEVAAVVVELMQGSGGCFPAEPGFIEGLQRFAAESGSLLIVDEVMTSRLGPEGLCAHHGLRPDLVTLGKYIGGGFSFGAVGGRSVWMDHFDLSRPGAWVHAGTFNNNVFTMTAVATMLESVYTREVASELSAAGDSLRQALNDDCAQAGLAMQVTGMGSMMNVHFAAGALRSSADIAAVSPELRDLFYLQMLEHGIWIARRGMVNLSVKTGPAECARFRDAVQQFMVRHGALLPRR